MTDATSLPASDRLSRNRIQGAYVSEILGPQVRRQTGCSISELNDLSLSVAVEREDSGLCTEALSYQVVAEKKVKGRADVRLDTKITAVRRSGTDIWGLEVLGGMVEEFDVVVLAMPYNATLLGLPEQEDEEMVYKPAFLTFVSTTDKVPIMDGKWSLLPTNPQSMLADSSTEIYELTYLRPYLYKISSNARVSYEQVTELFGEGVTEVVREEMEFAWPVMSARNVGEFGTLEIDDGLWGMGGSEGVVSSVDWSFIVGSNVGKMVAHRLVTGMD
jgi:hypothetical protein